MVGNLIKADLQVATFIEVAHQLLGNRLIMRWNKGFQLPQEYLYQCFPRGDTRQHVKFVVTVNFCKAIVIAVVKLLVGAPQGVYRNVIVDGDFSTCQCWLREVTTDTSGLPIYARTEKVTDTLLIYFQCGILYLL